MKQPPIPSAPASLLRRNLLLAGITSWAAGCAIRPRMENDPVPARLTEEEARELVLHASSLLGTPYRFGGNTPEGGFDCSGLIVYVFRHSAGLELPRTVALLSQVGRPVGSAELRFADLVFFRISRTLSHAGIFLGEQRFIHAPATGGVVRMDRLDTSYWKPRFLGGRRV